MISDFELQRFVEIGVRCVKLHILELPPYGDHPLVRIVFGKFHCRFRDEYAFLDLEVPIGRTKRRIVV